ncbi:pyridoxamine 5'-phosphate oxidase, partial [Rhizobium ruizarguesonis]
MRASELKLSAAASGRRFQNEGMRAVETEKHISSDVAFSPSVKEIQARKGSRRSYARVEERGGWATEITP